METLNSLASSLRYDRVIGLKNSLTNSLIRVFDAMRPANRLSNADSFMSSYSTHNTVRFFVKVFGIDGAKQQSHPVQTVAKNRNMVDIVKC